MYLRACRGLDIVKEGARPASGGRMSNVDDESGPVIELDESFAIDPKSFGDAEPEDMDVGVDPGFVWRDEYAPFLDSTDFPWLDGPRTHIRRR
jgi:hypothetical protein